MDDAGIELLEIFGLISGINEGCLIGDVQLFQRDPGPLGIWATERNQKVVIHVWMRLACRASSCTISVRQNCC